MEKSSKTTVWIISSCYVTQRYYKQVRSSDFCSNLVKAAGALLKPEPEPDLLAVLICIQSVFFETLHDPFEQLSAAQNWVSLMDMQTACIFLATEACSWHCAKYIHVWLNFVSPYLEIAHFKL